MWIVTRSHNVFKITFDLCSVLEDLVVRLREIKSCLVGDDGQMCHLACDCIKVGRLPFHPTVPPMCHPWSNIKTSCTSGNKPLCCMDRWLGGCFGEGDVVHFRLARWIKRGIKVDLDVVVCVVFVVHIPIDCVPMVVLVRGNKRG